MARPSAVLRGAAVPMPWLQRDRLVLGQCALDAVGVFLYDLLVGGDVAERADFRHRNRGSVPVVLLAFDVDIELLPCLGGDGLFHLVLPPAINYRLLAIFCRCGRGKNRALVGSYAYRGFWS